MPDVDSARDAAVRLPARVKVKVAARVECRGVEGFCGVTVWVNGRRADSAVYRVEGTDNGRAEMKGESSEGVDGCREL